MMGIFESMQRSTGNIDQIAGVVQDMYRKQRLAENAKRLQAAITKQVRPQSVQDQVASLTGVPMTPSGDLTNEPKNLNEMNAGDIGSISDVLRQSPELGGEVNLMNQAAQSRVPSMFDLREGENKYQLNPVTRKVELVAQNPKLFPPSKVKQLKLIRNGQPVYDAFRPGDQFYEPPKETKSDFLGTQNVEENGVMKKVDLYGYIDAQGKQHVQDKKYQDFTPAAGKTVKDQNLEERKTDLARVKQLTDANESLSNQLSLMGQAVDKKGKALYGPDALTKAKENIAQNQDEIARIHLKHNGKYTTLKVAREYYKSLDPNAPELKLDDAALKNSLENAGYTVGGPGAEGK